MHKLIAVLFFFPIGSAGQEHSWVAAVDNKKVTRKGEWIEDRFRFGVAKHLHTAKDGAALEFEFKGTGVAVRLGGHNVPAYRSPNLGRIMASIDGRQATEFWPRETPREIVLADGLKSGTHTVRLVHRIQGDLGGCRVEGFRVWSGGRGSLQFNVGGEAHSHLVDARAILRKDGLPVRNTLVRNWMSGQCSLTALPPGKGYSLEIIAAGWNSTQADDITIASGKPTMLKPIFLRRDEATIIHRFRFPVLNQPAIRQAGGNFRVRFLGFDTVINEVRLTRRVGPAIISRKLAFKEDEGAKYYYDREVIATLPKDMPPGAYDLIVQVTGGRRTGISRSPRSVYVVGAWPKNPVFVTFGHLDTSGQYQAEYLERIVDMANLIAPDMVLNSNAVNPAYISGAMAGLDMPYVVNFGNHQFPGHEAWYGDPVGLVDFGPGMCVLNFGHPWHTDTSKPEAFFASRPRAGMKIINAFEANAPLTFLDRHRVSMIHDAHGIGEKVMNMGATPTRRIGKSNSESFRVVRFKNGRVDSCTYNGHKTAPFPFSREEASPLRVTFAMPNDGTQIRQMASIKNDYLEPFPNARVTFVMPHGSQRVKGGRLEASIPSDDKKYSVVTARVDVPAKGKSIVTVETK